MYNVHNHRSSHLFESPYRTVKEKVANLKNLANSVLPSEEKNRYIQASDGPGFINWFSDQKLMQEIC